jgi:hypothetical protein
VETCWCCTRDQHSRVQILRCSLWAAQPALSTELASVECKESVVINEVLEDGRGAAWSTLGSTFSAPASHVLMMLLVSPCSGSGAGEAKDGCQLMGESGSRPAALILPPAPDSAPGPVGVVGVAECGVAECASRRAGRRASSSSRARCLRAMSFCRRARPPKMVKILRNGQNHGFARAKLNFLGSFVI